MEERKNGNSLTIEKKVLNCYRELSRMELMIRNLLFELKMYKNDHRETNLTESIGRYARDMPRFVIFKEQADYLKTCIRKICSGEFSMEVAISKGNELLKRIDTILAFFNKDAIDEYCNNNQS